jgi:hypothetical protein
MQAADAGGYANGSKAGLISGTYGGLGFECVDRRQLSVKAG